MPFDLEKKFIFVHIPKTGGVSIETSLDLFHTEKFYLGRWNAKVVDGVGYALQHLTLPLIKKLKPEVKDFKSFTVVRNPYEKAVSEFFFIHKDYHKKPKKSLDGFEKWLEDEYFLHKMDHTLPQYKFIDDSIGMIVKHEHLNERWFDICDYIEIPHKELPFYNRTGRNTSDLVKSLPQNIKDKIYKKFEKDFDTFGYSKNY